MLHIYLFKRIKKANKIRKIVWKLGDFSRIKKLLYNGTLQQWCTLFGHIVVIVESTERVKKTSKICHTH